MVERLAVTGKPNDIYAVGIDCRGGTIHYTFSVESKPAMPVVYLLTDLGSDEFGGIVRRQDGGGYILSVSGEAASRLSNIVRNGIPEMVFSYGFDKDDPEGQGVAFGKGLQLLEDLGRCGKPK